MAQGKQAQALVKDINTFFEWHLFFCPQKIKNKTKLGSEITSSLTYKVTRD